MQEAFLRMHRSAQDGADVDNLEAWATTVTTRLAIDTLRSARVRREQYAGPWLPEPIVPSEDGDPAHRLELADGRIARLHNLINPDKLGHRPGRRSLRPARRHRWRMAPCN